MTFGLGKGFGGGGKVPSPAQVDRDRARGMLEQASLAFTEQIRVVYERILKARTSPSITLAGELGIWLVS